MTSITWEMFGTSDCNSVRFKVIIVKIVLAHIKVLNWGQLSFLGGRGWNWELMKTRPWTLSRWTLKLLTRFHVVGCMEG